MDLRKARSRKTYKIRIKGIPDHSLFDWMDEIEIIPQDDNETVLINNFIDQPALRGFLDHLWNLNFTVISVESVDVEKNLWKEKG